MHEAISNELQNHTYREMNVSLEELFPKLDKVKVYRATHAWKQTNPHETIFHAAREMWNGGYEKILNENGFWDTKYSSFSGHCHQCTPELGLVFRSLGFDTVSYLECYRIREHFPETGIIEKIPPEEEPNPLMKDEFCGIGRIPYCCLEVEANGEKFYLTGKHVKPEGEKTNALLSPACYRNMIGVFAHPDDVGKSGIYLQPITPKQNPNNEDFSKRIVWKKQTKKDPEPEYFATYLRMKLI